MTQVSEARRQAVAILEAVHGGEKLNVAFGRVAPSLSPTDRKWVQELTYGATRLRGRLDHILDRRLAKGVGSLRSAVLDLLRIGLHQLLHMDGVPSYAAVSQTVEQARSVGGEGIARLVNGVLRAVERQPPSRASFPALETDAVGHLSSWGSHPAWLVERWLRRWSVLDVERLVNEGNNPGPVFLNPLAQAVDEAVERLAEAGVEAEAVRGGTPSIRLPRGADVGRALETISSIVQDPGASLVCAYVDSPAGESIVDLCAAPGGKTLALAAGGSYVLAADRSPERLRRVRENATRIGARVGLVAALAEAPAVRAARVVLLDVPCTGTGTLRRHPDARWRLAPGDIVKLARVQARILDGSAGLVPRGGLLVYATCTLEPEENEDQIHSFLERNTAFRLEPGTGVADSYLDEEGFLRVLPQESGFDGAFAARLRRVE